MPVIQIPFEMPLEIQKGIESGNLIRYGGVIRDKAGQIVQHLKEAPVPISDEKAVRATKYSKYFLIGTIIVTAIAGITYIVIKDKKNKETKIPKCVADFNQAFIAYLDAIKQGTVNERKISEVIHALEEIKNSQDKGDIDLVLSVENIDLLIEMVRNYTSELAKANSFSIPEDSCDIEDKIINLQHYLEIQKQIFETCV